MTTLTASQARAQLYKLVDRTADFHEPVQITGKRNSAILVSEEDWRSIQETLYLTEEAGAQLKALKADKGLEQRYKAVKKALSYLEANPRHQSLQTHEFTSLTKVFGKKVFEAYAQQNTPAAYRIFWHYGPGKNDITIVAITPHS